MKSFLLIFLLFSTNLTFACTHFRLTAEDKSVVIGRSMEFGPNLKTKIYTVNRDTDFKSQTPDAKPGLQWQSKYGYLALSGFNLFPVSGLNEKGLSYDLLYFPGVAEYEAYDAGHASQSMPYYQIADYILGNFITTDEIKEALPKLNIYEAPVNFQGKPTVFPVHYVVTDSRGMSIAIEFIAGKLNVYDDKTGILTNAPSYLWHVANLSNYVNLSPNAPDPIVKDGVTYNATGQGAGALGLPGDYTPPSRFVKTAYLVNTAKQMENAAKTVNLAEHILNNFDIPHGAIRGKKGENTASDMDYTQWIVIKDLKHHRLYFRSYNDLRLKKIDMQQLNFASGTPKRYMTLVDDDNPALDVTAAFKATK